MNVLVVDDDSSLRRTLRLSLELLGHQPVEARDSAAALELLHHRTFEVAFLDLRLAQEHGLEILPRLLQVAPGLQVVVVTAYATIETAVEAMRRGAFDYLPKPFTPDQLRLVLDRIARLRQLQSQVDDLEEQVRSVVPEVDLKTDEPQMREALEVAFKAAPTDASILLRGESGTGKGVLARAIHARSARAAAPFVTIHCPSLSAELLESELFGHVQGAFTGAVRDTLGKVAAAEGGTLFLDEIGDLPLALQPKLLRLLQEKCYERVGETQTRTSNVRVIAATNRHLEAEIATGRFREDLFYRLNVIEVTMLAAAAAHQRYSAAGRASVAILHAAKWQAHHRIRPSGARRHRPLSLAGKHPRTAQCHRARRDFIAGAVDPTERFAHADRKSGRRQCWCAGSHVVGAD